MSDTFLTINDFSYTVGIFTKVSFPHKYSYNAVDCCFFTISILNFLHILPTAEANSPLSERNFCWGGEGVQRNVTMTFLVVNIDMWTLP